MPSTSATTMATTTAIPTRESGTRPPGTAAFLILYAALLWPALAGGAHGGWPLVITELLLLLAYTGVYLLVVNLVRQRQQLDRLVRILLASGAVLAFLSIVEYLLRESR